MSIACTGGDSCGWGRRVPHVTYQLSLLHTWPNYEGDEHCLHRWRQLGGEGAFPT